MMERLSHRDIFAAVGYALTCWEQMELQLAGLYTILDDDAYSLEGLVQFGMNNRRFVDRIAAIARAAETYAIENPNQNTEGQVAGFLARATELAIERHRIAHGMLVVTPTADIDEQNRITYRPDQPIYWLGAPWYSVNSLRWALVGKQVHAIKAHAADFLSLRADVAALNHRLSSQEPPAAFSQLPPSLEASEEAGKVPPA
jgi:hypothetical protein